MADIEDYPAAARSIALNLREWFPEDKKYPEAIADAARSARAEIDNLRATVFHLKDACEAVVEAVNTYAARHGAGELSTNVICAQGRCIRAIARAEGREP
jgi:hypothetical protein